MKRTTRFGIAVICLGLFAAFLIATGKWDLAVLTPVRELAGAEAAQGVDTTVRGGLKAGQDLAEEAKNSSIPELIGKLPKIETPSMQRTPKYDRDQFGKGGWQFDLKGCSTRENILKRDLKKVTMRTDRKCKVWTGVLDPDPYAGKRIEFDSKTDPQAVQIDHVVPLKAAWELGAWEWDSNVRVQFANDPLNLVASDGPSNNAKGDKTPSRWMPKNKAFQCEYASRYVKVTEKYRLPMADADKETLEKVLDQC